MDRSTLVTIILSAVVGAIAKEAIAALLGFSKRAWLSGWARRNVGLLSEVAGVVFYAWALFWFAQSTAPVTGLVVLEIIGCALGLLVTLFSLIFRLAKVQARRERQQAERDGTREP